MSFIYFLPYCLWWNALVLHASCLSLLYIEIPRLTCVVYVFYRYLFDHLIYLMRVMKPSETLYLTCVLFVYLQVLCDHASLPVRRQENAEEHGAYDHRRLADVGADHAAAAVRLEVGARSGPLQRLTRHRYVTSSNATSTNVTSSNATSSNVTSSNVTSSK